MVPQKLSFVDVETTGISAIHGRIIEIGIVRVEEGRIVKELSTLINPERNIDPFISDLTGITQSDLLNAPVFYEVKDEIEEILKDTIFVAHNVRFDYSFLRNEFKRNGSSFNSKYFCTVKLARLLFPGNERYGLDALIEKFNIKCKNRHRAFDDAKAIHDFYNISQKIIDEKKFEEAIDIVLKKPTIPANISIDELENLPEAPGVYIFYGENNSILYVGKSINIKERIFSHFSNDHGSLTDQKISQQLVRIETISTAGELGALLLESTLIKKHQPILNRLLRQSKKMQILLKNVDEKGFNGVKLFELSEIDVDQVGQILGVFKTKKQANDFLYKVAKEYKLCPKLLGLEKGKGYCFNYHLKKCLGACNNEELNLKYNIRFDEGLYSRKIRPWRFDSPILIKEEGETNEAHIIDKWCYLGSIKNEYDEIEGIKKEYRFDYDTYKILSRYIMNPKNMKKIKPFKLGLDN